MSTYERIKISIRQAIKEDINAIMSFINTEWKDQHILARDKSFFTYEHTYDDKVNFIIACNGVNEIIGLIGFIICAPGELSDACTVIWKVAKPSGHPALGIKLLQYVSRLEKVRYILSPGINESTVPIYSFLGMFTGELEQYYLLNPKKKQFEIGKIITKSIEKDKTNEEKISGYTIELMECETEIKKFPFHKFKDQVPYKNEAYFIKRYCHHPVFQYMIYGFYLDNVILALIVLRKQPHNGASALRFIDYYGDQEYLAFTGVFFESLLIEQDCEYLDFYCYGFKNDLLRKAGFTIISEEDKNIIPNYFSPFIQENIKIRFFSNTKNHGTIRLCKGDGDQDRPN